MFAGAALAWLGFAAVRPLPRAAPSAGEAIPSVPIVSMPAATAAERREMLALLGSENLFDAEREAWSGRRAAAETPMEGEGAAEKKPAATGGETTIVAGQAVPVTKPAALPEDVKQALTGLALRGVYAPKGDGQYVALISRVHGGPNPLLSDAFRAGDEFEDKQHPQAKWKVVAIDGPGRRVVLQRGGVNAVLEMYVQSASAPKPAEPAAPAKPAVSVVAQTKEEIEAALRGAKFSEEKVARLMELAAMEPDQAAAAAALAALARSEKEAQAKPGKRPPPPGLEAIARLLQTPPKQMEGEPAPPAEAKPER